MRDNPTAWWAYSIERRSARAASVERLSSGGTYTGFFHPFVTMSHNLLPFDPKERGRFQPHMRLRFYLLEHAQGRTFQRADGVIFITQTSRNMIEATTGSVKGAVAVIPHGVADRFRAIPRPARSVAECSIDNPFRWLYVSIVNVYKHQWHVATATSALRARGLPVALDLIGPSIPKALQRLRVTLGQLDPEGAYISYRGPVPYDQLAACYWGADAFAFASSCETMPFILLEAMASGLPIACSERGVMPEVLGDSGLYFDPERPDSIAAAMDALMNNVSLSNDLAEAAYQRSLSYSWDRCARDTFEFLARVAH